RRISGMRRLPPAIRALALIAGAASCALALFAGTAGSALAAEEVTYVAPGAEVQWVAVRAPLATEQLGVIASSAAERVRAASAAAQVPDQPALLGEVPAAAPTEGWAARPLEG